MAIAHAVLEEASDLGAVIKGVRAVACHARLLILADVRVSELEVGNHLTMEVAVFKLAIENTLHILQRARAMHLTFLELAAIVLSRLRRPLIKALTVELSIGELSFVVVTRR